MTILALQAAKHLCKQSKWKYNHLELQKIIYIAHVIHFGRYDEPLVYGYYEACDHGMVHPDLHQLMIFGAQSVEKSFPPFARVEGVDGGSERLCLDVVGEFFPPGRGPLLIEFNNEYGAAWRDAYNPNRFHNVVSDDAILNEYKFYERKATEESAI